LLTKGLVIEHAFEYNRSMQLGDHDVAERAERSPLDEALDHLDSAVNELIAAVESGGLDQLSAEEKVAVWQRFERIRNRLPLIDHGLITAAEAADLARDYCSSTMTQFLVRVLQLSHSEAASRVRAAAAVGPRTTVVGEKLQPQLTRLAALQRDGLVSPEKVQIVERAMHKLSRPDLDPHAVQTAEELLTDYAPVLGYSELRRYAVSVVMPPTLTGPSLSMINCNTTAAMWS
jgi:hypothetical protein